jgi:gliding motility-associated-like protein
MQKAALSLLFFLIAVITAFSQHTPIAVTGFNHDVIAEGTGNSALSTTTKEMDALSPSNYVLCSKQFTTANAFTPANTYGIPDNGIITSGGRTYQLANYTGSNALYLFPTETGTLTLTTPSNFSNISIAALGTEGAATLSITFNFSDGSSLSSTGIYEDWFNGTNGIILQGFGRVKRISAPFTGQYGGAPDNPRMYSREFSMPCSKMLTSISFSNTSSATLTQSNRAHIFAISGIQSVPPPQPVISGGGITVCPGATPTLTVQGPVVGVTYSWYTSSFGGVALATGTTFTTPPLSGAITYYAEAASSCTNTTRTAVTIDVTPAPATPVVNGSTICSGTTATLNVQSPVAGISYSWYSSCASGTALATGNSFTTPPLSSATSYYVKAINSCSSVSSCVTVAVNTLTPVSAPAASGTTICPGTTATLTVQSPVGGVTYSWFAAAAGGIALSTGTGFTTPVLAAATTYYVQAQDGCGSSTRTPVTVNITPPVSAPTVNSITICPGNNATLTVQSPAAGVTYKWYNSATGGSLVFTGTSLSLPAPISSLTYYVEASNACSVSPRVAATINLTTVTTPIINPITICAGNTAFLSIQNPLGTETYRWYTAATGGSSISSGTTYTTPALSANTTYYVEAVNSITCTGPSRVAVAVTVIPILTAPVVSVTNATVSSVTFGWAAVPNATGYEISLNNGVTWIPLSALSYTFTGLSQFQDVCLQVRAIRTPSCANSAVTSICGRSLSTVIFIPNTFTPNNDGKNDIFYVHSNGIQSMKIQVFNQWGEKLFESQDKSHGWDGSYKGKVQPVGVYVYVFKATLSDGSSVTRHGSISLIR